MFVVLTKTFRNGMKNLMLITLQNLNERLNTSCREMNTLETNVSKDKVTTITLDTIQDPQETSHYLRN